MLLVKRKIAFLGMLGIVLMIWQMAYPSKVYADNTCWTSGQGGFSFGNLSAEEGTTTNMNVTATCQGSYGKDVWFRVCLQPNTGTLSMNTNTSPVYSLNFQVFTVADMINALDVDNPAQLTMKAGDNQSVSAIFRLVGRIIPGQKNVPAMDYFNYYFPLNIRWASADSENLLPSCAAGITVAPFPASAMATVQNACSISGVSTMNFGSLLGGQTPLLRGKAQGSITIQCPVGAAYSIELDNGQHFNGSQRQLCSSGGECISYGLWKDNVATQAWGNVPGISALDVSSSSGEYSRYIVYGVLPPQPWPSPGRYTDSIIVTLWY